MNTVDTREPAERAEPFVRAGWQKITMHAGDYGGADPAGNIWLIEHKRVYQLIADMETGQLINQCRRVCEAARYPVLMVEGRWIMRENGELMDSRLTWHEAWNELQTVQDMGMRLQITTGHQHSIDRIFELARYYAKQVHESALRAVSGDQMLATLCLIPGVGTAKATQLRAKYETLGHLAAASAGNTIELPGFGPVLVDRVRRFFGDVT